jgi:hypothetical protein
MADMERNDRVSPGLMRFLESLTPAERDQFRAIMRQPNTYLAEDITDLLAILDGLKRH